MEIMRKTHLALTTALLFVCMVGACAHGEELLDSNAAAYLQAHSDQNADASSEHAFFRNAAEAMKENESISDESRYADDKVLDFFSDRKKHFENSDSNPLSDKDKIEIARWYLLYFKNGWRFPSRIAVYLTKSNFERDMEGK
jgi:hypothetical protein